MIVKKWIIGVLESGVRCYGHITLKIYLFPTQTQVSFGFAMVGLGISSFAASPFSISFPYSTSWAGCNSRAPSVAKTSVIRESRLGKMLKRQNRRNWPCNFLVGSRTRPSTRPMPPHAVSCAWDETKRQAVEILAQFTIA